MKGGKNMKKIKEKLKCFADEHEEVVAAACVIIPTLAAGVFGYTLGTANERYKVNMGLTAAFIKNPKLKTELLTTLEEVNDSLSK